MGNRGGDTEETTDDKFCSKSEYKGFGLLLTEVYYLT
jgi:hypothetical protein